MAITIEQKPNSSVIPIGQDVIFSVSDSTVLASHFNVRFYCDVMYSSTTEALQSKIVTLKTTPNAAGSGIFDLRRALESELSADYTLDSDNNNVKFKGEANVVDAPIHHIQMLSTSKNISGNFTCNFYVKGSASVGSSISNVGSVVSSDSFFVYNGQPDANDPLTNTSGDYHYDLDAMGLFQNGKSSQFLSGLPTTIYAGLSDVGTVGILQGMSNFYPGYTGIGDVMFRFYDSSDTLLNDLPLSTATAQGGTPFNGATTNSSRASLFVGVYPGNIRQYFPIHSNVSYYTFEGRSTAGLSKTNLYRVNIVEECKYPVNRLCWLNKFGTWDYYNFTVKSTRSTSATRKFYNSSRGDWSGSKFRHTHYRGGKTVYKMDSTDSITLNTDYLSEEEGVWLESLMSSSEVFLIKEGNTWEVGDASVPHTDFRDLVEPVVITNSAITRRTKVNDTLISHQFTIEKSNNNNTHRS
jgi:hypothetical protein